MSWLGDVLSFENFNAKGILGKLGKNPERALIGAVDPFSTRVWNGVLGTNYEPIVNQLGGASSDTYGKAQAAGINTGPGGTMHNIAGTIASLYAGGYGANQAGGLLGSSVPTTSSGFGGVGTDAGVNSAGLFGGSGSSAASPGLLGTFNQYAKPVGQGLQMAQSAQGLFGGHQQPMQAQPLHPSGDPIGGLLQSQQQQEMMRQQLLDKLRRGTYGGTL